MTGIRSAFDDIAVFRGRLFLLVAVVGLVIAGLTIPFQLNGRLWSELFNLAHAPVFCGLALLIAGIRDPRRMGCHRSRFIRCLRAETGL